MQPKLVDRNISLLLELVGPLSTVLVLNILPFWSDSSLEKMVVGFESQLGGRGNIILIDLLVPIRLECKMASAYIYTPKLLHRIESDDLLQQIVPVVSLVTG